MQSTSVAGMPAIASIRLCRAPRFGGRNPSKKNRSVGRPETTSAVSIAEGPGIGVTGSPAAIAA